jgi:hypothetical protein
MRDFGERSGFDVSAQPNVEPSKRGVQYPSV